jgi:hypothetical protein
MKCRFRPCLIFDHSIWIVSDTIENEPEPTSVRGFSRICLRELVCYETVTKIPYKMEFKGYNVTEL